MIVSPYSTIDTPALLVDMDLVKANLQEMQDKADYFSVALRPHTKTHKMPELAQLQVSLGAQGIAVAKLGEAEVMAQYGLANIFIANQIVGRQKMIRLRKLAQCVNVTVGIDCAEQVWELAATFSDAKEPIGALIEIEVGENRCGVNNDADLIDLAGIIASSGHVKLCGIFAHEGHTYSASNVAESIDQALAAQTRLVEAAELLRAKGFSCETVSVGATPSMLHADILPGITEIRPGTYIFRDVGQAGAAGTFSLCAATVLTTVISKPTTDRVVLDAGAKALTMQRREGGICHTDGYGAIKGQPEIRLARVFDEHGIVNDARLASQVKVGDKIEVIPNHICPAVNLYDKAFWVSGGTIIGEAEIACRGKTT